MQPVDGVAREVAFWQTCGIGTKIARPNGDHGLRTRSRNSHRQSDFPGVLQNGAPFGEFSTDGLRLALVSTEQGTGSGGRQAAYIELICWRRRGAEWAGRCARPERSTGPSR